MGHEYVAVPDLPASQGIIEKVLDEVSHLAGWAEVHRSHDTLAVRVASEPLRDYWAEDVTMTLSEAQMYVIFHSMRGGISHELLQELTQLFATHGICLSDFEEL